MNIVLRRAEENERWNNGQKREENSMTVFNWNEIVNSIYWIHSAASNWFHIKEILVQIHKIYSIYSCSAEHCYFHNSFALLLAILVCAKLLSVQLHSSWETIVQFSPTFLRSIKPWKMDWIQLNLKVHLVSFKRRKWSSSRLSSEELFVTLTVLHHCACCFFSSLHKNCVIKY